MVEWRGCQARGESTQNKPDKPTYNKFGTVNLPLLPWRTGKYTILIIGNFSSCTS